MNVHYFKGIHNIIYIHIYAHTRANTQNYGIFKKTHVKACNNM